ncbi:hypothetical protein GQR58_010672 [Nymphon striatum]|nr:hypothetical protein GQR58_010672 [Nymphon striatum]
MVTISIVGILLFMGSPSLKKTIQKNKMSALHNELLSSLNLARSTAITRGSWATLCNADETLSGCGDADTNWLNGWLVFHDRNNNGTVDNNEDIISLKSDISEGVKILSSRNRVTYGSGGFAIGYTGNITFCDDRGDDARRGMIKAQNYSQDAYFRTQATVIAHDILERIRANPEGQQAGIYHLPSAIKHSSCYSESGCGVEEMSENDMYEWAGNPVGDNSNSVARLLPGGSAIICIDSTPNDGEASAPACDGSGSVYAAKVWWNHQGDETYRVFSSTKTSARLLGAEAELQENARFAFSVITSIVQEAGNFGCQASTSLSNNSLVNPVNDTFKPWNVIEGWEAKDTAYGEKYTASIDSGVSAITTQHWLSSGVASKDSGTKSKKYSDIFKVWYTKKQNAKVSDLSGGVLTFSPLDIDKGDILAINDCRSVTFAQVCSCEDNDCQGNDTKANINPGACSNPGNNNLKFDNFNMDTATIGILEQAIFFVGKRSDGTAGYKEHMPSLYMRNLGSKGKPGNKVEILEGVESLQILYGEDTDADHSSNRYLSADLVGDWNNIAAESALNSGESFLNSATIDGLAGIFDDTDGLYTFEVNRQLYNTADWENLDKRESHELHQLTKKPVYIIEELSNIEAIGNSLQVPKQSSGEYYRVTSKSEGGTDASIVVLQSMYKK